MELHLTPETEAKLNDLAKRTSRRTDELLGEAVDYLVSYNDWFERKVKDSMAAAEGSPTIPNEEVAAWLDQRERRSHAD
jgi:predicted transcriptional regulator